MPGDDLRFYLTTGPSGTADGDPQSDPALSLGRFRSDTVIHEFQSTLTAAQSVRARNFVVDSSRIGDGDGAHNFKWLLMQTGVNALSAARVMAFVSASGTFKLDRLLGPSVAGIGDDYAIFDLNNVWPDVTALQAKNGDERFRCIALRNEHGVAITDVRFYFIPLNNAGDELDRFNQDAVTGAFLQRSDDTTDLFDSLGQRDALGGPDNFAGSGPWLHPFGFAVADTEVPSQANNGSIAIWLRRTSPENHRFRRSMATMLVAETSITGSDPDPLIGACILPYNVLGSDPTATIEQDRFLFVGGGQRLVATVLTEGLLTVDRPARWDIQAGDLGTIFTDDDPIASFDTTDEDGKVQATLISPVSQAAAGQITHPELIIGAGDEVADP